MATQQAGLFQLNGLGKRKLAAVVRRARQLGMTPHGYLKHLVDEDLAVSERAKKSTFAELLGPGRAVDEGELDRLVEEARTSHHKGKQQRG